MAKIKIPLSDGLMNDLGEAMSAFDERQNAGQSLFLVEWKVPPMPKTLKGEIRSDEHPPPHFHVQCAEEEASFSILDGMRLPGVTGLERYDRVIWRWWKENERELCLIWNRSRPTDCQVGPVDVPPAPRPN